MGYFLNIIVRNCQVSINELSKQGLTVGMSSLKGFDNRQSCCVSEQYCNRSIKTIDNATIAQYWSEL